MDKQINHDKFHDESKTRNHKLNKLPDDGDPWAPNKLLTPEQKKNTNRTSVGQATDKIVFSRNKWKITHHIRKQNLHVRSYDWFYVSEQKASNIFPQTVKKYFYNSKIGNASLLEKN